LIPSISNSDAGFIHTRLQRSAAKCEIKRSPFTKTPPALAAWSFNFDLLKHLHTTKDTIGFSRMEFSLSTYSSVFIAQKTPSALAAWSFTFEPGNGSEQLRPKLRLHAAEASGVSLTMNTSG